MERQTAPNRFPYRPHLAGGHAIPPGAGCLAGVEGEPTHHRINVVSLPGSDRSGRRKSSQVRDGSYHGLQECWTPSGGA